MEDNRKMLMELALKRFPEEDEKYIKDICLVLFDVYNHILHCEKSGVSEADRKRIIHFAFDEDTYDEDYLYAHARVLSPFYEGPGGDLGCLMLD